jgi:transcriptional regulator
MYIPEQFEERDVSVLHALIRAHPLGAWVTGAGGSLVVNHIPFLVDPDRGPAGTLVGHVARANGVWKTTPAIESVVVFQGAQGYITPSWYPTKHQTGKAVPTWNYAVVHAHGSPRIVDDRDWLLRHVSELTRVHESARDVPWQVTDAPPDFVAALLNGIVGIEIPIARLEGKWKASQNRPLADRLGVVAGLANAGDAASREMARLVEERGTQN